MFKQKETELANQHYKLLLHKSIKEKELESIIKSIEAVEAQLAIINQLKSDDTEKTES